MFPILRSFDYDYGDIYDDDYWDHLDGENETETQDSGGGGEQNDETICTS